MEDEEAAGQRLLLDHSDFGEKTQDDCTLRRRQKRTKLSWMVVLSIVTALLAIVHILFVALLRNTTVRLKHLTLPDLCHRSFVGEIVLESQNPSYCSPEVGPLSITFANKNTAFLHIQIAAFDLQSGVTTMVFPVEFKLLTPPEVLYHLVTAGEQSIDISANIPVLISCMLVPFTIHLDISMLSKENSGTSVNAVISPQWKFTFDAQECGVNASESGVVNKMKSELQYVFKQILTTIALSDFHTQTSKEKIFAFTDVSFKYVSRFIWNLLSFSLEVQSAERKTILVADFKQFYLGGGHMFISAYTEIFKNQSAPLQSMLQSYLTGNDVVLHVSGINRNTDCYLLEVLDLVEVKVNVPAKINNKPVLLRAYSIKLSLKELDSRKCKCLLELRVSIKINNPLPISFDLYGIEFNLFYEKDSTNDSPRFLVHVKDTTHVEWVSHEVNSIVLQAAVHNFNTCMEVVDFHFHNQLSIDIEHGNILMGAGSGNLSIPFSMRGIHIYP